MTYLDQATKSGKYFVRDDPLSLPKAILYGVAKVIPGTESANNSRMSTFRLDMKKWNEKAEKLLTDMGMEPKEKYTEKDLKKLSTHFTEHYFTLYTRERGDKVYKPNYSTGNEGIRIDLMMYEGTYAWFKTTQKNMGHTICQLCKEKYNKKQAHSCYKSCRKCRFPLKECIQLETDHPRDCTTCLRKFQSLTCFENHLRKYEKRAKACDISRKCIKCGLSYNSLNGIHTCRLTCELCRSPGFMVHDCAENVEIRKLFEMSISNLPLYKEMLKKFVRK